LSRWGQKNGLTDCGFTDQCHFLLSLGVQDIVREVVSQENNLIMAAKKASLLNYALLIDMGTKFKVLIQKKGDCTKELSGLRIPYPQGTL
jgi:SAM-dependent MidA family methyltransferase